MLIFSWLQQLNVKIGGFQTQIHLTSKFMPLAQLWVLHPCYTELGMSYALGIAVSQHMGCFLPAEDSIFQKNGRHNMRESPALLMGTERCTMNTYVPAPRKKAQLKTEW